MKTVTRFESVEALKQAKGKNIDPEVRLKRHSDFERLLLEIYNSQSQNGPVGKIKG